jgi:citronellol/citronellal dehydrogenase
MTRFTGRRALVTGSSYGIGAAVADRLAAEGADVFLCARTLTDADRGRLNPRSLADTARLIGRHGSRVGYARADLADAGQRAGLVALAGEELGGPIDILVNNAAAGIYKRPSQISLQHRQVTFEVNVQAPIDLAQAALPFMLEQGAGWIVNITSGAAQAPRGPADRPDAFGAALGIYGASKAALDRYTIALAAELADTGVRVNAVAPNGAVRSDGAVARGGLDAIPPEAFESMDSMVDSVVALADCAPEVTGHVLRSGQVAGLAAPAG